MRHNETRDTFANLMREVCFDVEIEPKLQSLQGESFVNTSTTTDEDARLDVKASGLWGSRFSRNFFDVKFFKQHAKTSRRKLKDAYKYHESLKNSKCQQRILQVEQSNFCPLITGCTRGAAPAITRTMQRIAEQLSEKRHESYAKTINYVRYIHMRHNEIKDTFVTLMREVCFAVGKRTKTSIVARRELCHHFNHNC